MDKKFFPETDEYSEPTYLRTSLLVTLAVIGAFVPIIGFVVAILINRKSKNFSEYLKIAPRQIARAQDDARKILSRAQTDAAALTGKAQAAADKILADAQTQAAALTADAQKRLDTLDEELAASKASGAKIIAEANGQSERILRNAEADAFQITEKANIDARNITRDAEAHLRELDGKIANRERIVAGMVADATQQAERRNLYARNELERIQAEIDKRAFYYGEVERVKQNLDILRKKESSLQDKIDLLMRIRKAVNAAVRTYEKNFPNLQEHTITLPADIVHQAETLAPSVMLKLHSMDYRDLRRAFRANEKLIEDTLTRYETRYTTKTNRAIYRLMVIALRAELQNILYTLTSGKLSDALAQVRSVTGKYLNIASEGNQTISSTLAKFVGEMEVLFLDAVKIEYEYFVKREAARQEQLELRAKMREEAEEQRRLKEQQQQMEREQSKYNAEIENLLEQANSTDDAAKTQALFDKIRALELQVADLSAKRDEIITLQNGKAGYVYVISNLGSFGSDVFKIGMTRRLNPQERIDELGSASVPFKFDVHSFIFSKDAVKLESDLHAALNSRRLNKVNLRKEFFKIPIDELEQLVEQFDPAAEFNRTMQAEQYYQSLSASEQ